MKNNRYINSFLKKYKSASDLLYFGLFPNGKEITESLATLRAAKEYCVNDINQENTLFISIGDGCTPRTALTTAYYTKWDTISIDPNLRLEELTERFEERNVERCELHKNKVEDVGDVIDKEYDNVIVAMVHSHAKMKAVNEFLQRQTKINRKQNVFLIYMPCCFYEIVDQNNYDEIARYKDDDILSPKNNIEVHKWLGAKDKPKLMYKVYMQHDMCGPDERFFIAKTIEDYNKEVFALWENCHDWPTPVCEAVMMTEEAADYVNDKFKGF
ncbi:MAG: hypothetical protein GY679_01460 [Mycoplasma sp.]|nr:hypothetical protein [Mycoplasma sp.]